MNSDLSDIATNGLTNAITKDGQTTITGALKGASGSVGAPSYSFSADLDSGMYRIGANNVGISVNATKILDIATTGMSVTGTLAVSGAQTFTGQASFPAGFLSGDGTVSLPAWSFTSDPDSGVYRIGANNIGVAVNAAKVLDISATGLGVTGTITATGTISSNGTVLAPQAQSAGMINGTIVESHAGNAVTFAIKTLAGADPSATDPVFVAFRNVTAATGNYVTLQITAALSLVVTSGSTLGTVSSNVPFKLWLVLFNDASTVRLGIINTVTGGATPTNIYPLGQFPIASSTAEGGAGGADSPAVFYTGTAVSSKAYVPIGYAAYETGQTTAGAWAASPTRLQLFGGGVPLPGATIQVIANSTTTAGTTTSATFVALTSGQTQAIVLTSATSLVRVTSIGTSNMSATAAGQVQIARGSTLIGNPIILATTTSGSAPAALMTLDFPQSASSQTYGFQGKTASGTLSYPATGSGAHLQIEEVWT